MLISVLLSLSVGLTDWGAKASLTSRMVLVGADLESDALAFPPDEVVGDVIRGGDGHVPHASMAMKDRIAALVARRVRSALRGVPLCARELDRRHGRVADDPSIVAGLNLVRLPWTELRLAAVVGHHVQPSRQDVSDVVGLARVRLRDRLDAV